METQDKGRQVLTVVKSNENPVDVNHVATQLNVHWITAYKLIMEHILNDLKNNHRETLQKLTLIPIKTTKGWIFTTRKEVCDLTLEEPHGGSY